MRAAVYLRVSTEEQSREGFSIDAQKTECMRHIALKNYELYDIYTDAGLSAKNMKRPALQRMMADMENRSFDIVIFWRLDRLTRSVKDKSIIFEKFEKYNIDFKSIKEDYDTTTAAGRMVLNIMVSIAQGERETIGERVYMGEEQKALSGKRNGAIAPVGYDLIEGKLIPNNDADFVRRLFKMYQEHKGMGKIAKELGEEGRRMHVKTIHYILTNPQYCGLNRWNHRSKGIRTHKDIITEGQHEGLISEEEFERVQQIIGVRRNKGKAATSDFPFTGLLKCGKCGSPMTGGSRSQKSRRYKFYRCSSKVNYSQPCTMPVISEQAVVNAFLQSLDMGRRELSKMIKLSEAPKPERNESERIEREIQAIQKRKKKWQVAYANDGITLEELKAHTDEDRKREQYLKMELDKTEVVHYPSLTKQQIVNMVSQIRDTWNQSDDDVTKKEFINYLFSSITIDIDEMPRPHHADDVELNLEWVLK